MTQFLEDVQSGGLERAKPTMDIFCPTGNSPAYDEWEARQEQERLWNKKKAEEKELQWNIKRLGGLKAYNNFTLDKYDNKAAVELCSEFPERNLYIWGSAGAGKTHLATALIRDYKDALVVKPQRIYRDCRGIKDGREEQAAIDGYIRLPFLVIDDLGQDKRTDFSFQTLYEIIEGRDMGEMKGLIITSNYSLTDLAARMESDCIISRINGLCRVVEITREDRRMKI